MAASQAFSDRLVFDQADVEFRAQFMQSQRLARAMSKDLISWRDYVRMIDPARAYTDPVSKEIVEIWLEADPRMRRSNGGPPQFETATPRQRSITRLNYEKAMRESLSDLRHPTMRAAMADLIGSWGQSAEYTRREQFWEVLLAGDSATYGTTYDGQFLFDTDHPGVLDGSAVSQVNVYDLAFSETNLDTVLTAAELYVDGHGVNFGFKWRAASMQTPQTDRERQLSPVQPSFHVVTGPVHRNAVAALANDNSTSKYAGTFTWETSDFLRGAFDGYWLVFLRNGTPILHIDTGVNIDSKMGSDTEPGRLFNAAEWIARGEWGFAYDDWHCMIMGRN